MHCLALVCRYYCASLITEHNLMSAYKRFLSNEMVKGRYFTVDGQNQRQINVATSLGVRKREIMGRFTASSPLEKAQESHNARTTGREESRRITKRKTAIDKRSGDRKNPSRTDRKGIVDYCSNPFTERAGFARTSKEGRCVLTTVTTPSLSEGGVERSGSRHKVRHKPLPRDTHACLMGKFVYHVPTLQRSPSNRSIDYRQQGTDT